MPSPRQRFGTRAEDQAEQFLRKKGFVILDRHVTSRYGEIDILAKDDKTIVAVEVKARRSNKFGTALESITDSKLTKISATLNDVLEKRKWRDQPIRIDVVIVKPSTTEYLKGVGPE